MKQKSIAIISVVIVVFVILLISLWIRPFLIRTPDKLAKPSKTVSSQAPNDFLKNISVTTTKRPEVRDIDMQIAELKEQKKIIEENMVTEAKMVESASDSGDPDEKRYRLYFKDRYQSILKDIDEQIKTLNEQRNSATLP